MTESIAAFVRNERRVEAFLVEARRLAELLDPDSAEVRLLALFDTVSEQNESVLNQLAVSDRHVLGVEDVLRDMVTLVERSLSIVTHGRPTTEEAQRVVERASVALERTWDAADEEATFNAGWNAAIRGTCTPELLRRVRFDHPDMIRDRRQAFARWRRRERVTS